MPVTVVNSGVWVRDTNGRKTTDIANAEGGQGTVTVEYQGIQYVFGPGQSKTFSDLGIAAAVVVGDGRLRVADTRESLRVGGGQT